MAKVVLPPNQIVPHLRKGKHVDPVGVGARHLQLRRSETFREADLHEGGCFRDVREDLLQLGRGAACAFDKGIRFDYFLVV